MKIFAGLFLLSVVSFSTNANASGGFGEAPKTFDGPSFRCQFSSGDKILKKEPLVFGVEKDGPYCFIEVRHPKTGKKVRFFGKFTKLSPCQREDGYHCAWGFFAFSKDDTFFLNESEALRNGDSRGKLLVKQFTRGAHGYLVGESEQTDTYDCEKE